MTTCRRSNLPISFPAAIANQCVPWSKYPWGIRPDRYTKRWAGRVAGPYTGITRPSRLPLAEHGSLPRKRGGVPRGGVYPKGTCFTARSPRPTQHTRKPSVVVGADDERRGAKRNKYPWGIRPYGLRCVFRGGQSRPPLRGMQGSLHPTMTLPLFRCSRSSRIMTMASATGSLVCAPVVMFLQDTIPAAISSSPRNRT